MTTIVNNPGETERLVERERLLDNGSSSAGWAMSVIILLAVIAVGAYLWMQFQGGAVPQAPAGTGDTNIEVTIPTPLDQTSGANGPEASAGSFVGSLSDSNSSTTR